MRAKGLAAGSECRRHHHIGGETEVRALATVVGTMDWEFRAPQRRTVQLSRPTREAVMDGL
jgi:hypothetical protein